MIVVITEDAYDETSVVAVLSKAGKKPKDSSNLTKKGTVKKDLIRKKLKKRKLF